MKNFTRKLSILMAVPLLSGCIYGSTKLIYDKTTSIMSSSTVNSTKIYLSVQKCDGEVKYQITVSEKMGLYINSNFWCDSGSVEMTVSDINDEAFFNQTINEDTNFDVELKEYGKYYITLNHSAFKGKYNITWSGK